MVLLLGSIFIDPSHVMPRSTKELDAEAKEIWEAKIHINHRRPKKYVEEEDTEVHGPVVKTPVQGGKNNWCFIIFLSVFICGIVTLRVLSGRCKLLPKSHSEESYDYDYDAFTKNYEILGLPATETVTQRQIKEAYTPLALKWFVGTRCLLVSLPLTIF